jgi:hypothetical protein
MLSLTILSGCGESAKPTLIPVANFAGTWVGTMTSSEGNTHSITVNFSEGAAAASPSGLEQQAPLAAGATLQSTTCTSLATATSVDGKVNGSAFSTDLKANDNSTFLLKGAMAGDGKHIFNASFQFASGCLDSLGAPQTGTLTLNKQ